jgi:hypothetical protein
MVARSEAPIKGRIIKMCNKPTSIGVKARLSKNS